MQDILQIANMMATKLVHHQQEAEDLAGEALLRIYKSTSFVSDTPPYMVITKNGTAIDFAAYLHRVIRNLYYTQFRKTGPFSIINAADLVQISEDGEEVSYFDTLKDTHNPDPEEIILTQERITELKITTNQEYGLFERLKLSQKEQFVAKEWMLLCLKNDFRTYGLNRQLADITKLTPNEIGLYLNRIRRKAKRYLTPNAQSRQTKQQGNLDPKPFVDGQNLFGLKWDGDFPHP